MPHKTIIRLLGVARNPANGFPARPLAKRQEAKRLGLCVGCGAPPIPDETRCETCAENHRVNRRQSQKNAKQKAAQREIQESDQTTFL